MQYLIKCCQIWPIRKEYAIQTQIYILRFTIERHSNYPEIEARPPLTKLDRSSLERKQSRSIETITIVFPRRRDRVTNETELRSSPRYDRAGYLIVQEVQGGTGSCRIRRSTVVKETLVKRLCNIRLWIEIASASHQQYLLYRLKTEFNSLFDEFLPREK